MHRHAEEPPKAEMMPKFKPRHHLCLAFLALADLAAVLPKLPLRVLGGPLGGRGLGR
jgi:hypothetical protein